MNLKKRKNELLFVPLGGAGEIGMNVNCYHYQGKWIMFDLGAGFADEDIPGVDMVAPDLEFIYSQGDNFLGLVLTHAHEDHLGSVSYLWGQLECPIYATPFTAAIVKAKLAGDGIPQAAEIHEVQPNSMFEVGPFGVELVQITHSIPEMNGAIIRTDHGTIMHTGDWKIDPDPVVGPATDEARLKQYGDEGVLCMVCDSTNIMKDGESGSEGELLESLTSLIAKQSGAIAVTTFASNVARIDTIARAAMTNGRKVALLGRSLERIVNAAQETGYLQDLEFVDQRHVKKIPRKEILVLCTGCQGEPQAAMSKIASQQHPLLRLVPGDTVIFSSKVIPGNERKIFKLYNALIKMGVEVVTEKDHFVHVSGHPCRDEVKQMYSLIRPEISIPVHGEALHLHEHVKFAKELGVSKQVEVTNGQIVKIAPGDPSTIGYVQSGYLAVDGFMLVSTEGDVIRKRKGMTKDGIIFISVLVDKKGKLLTTPQVSTPGVLDEKENKAFIEEISEDIAEAIERVRENIDSKIATAARKAVRNLLKYEIGKFPAINVHVTRV